MRSVALLCALAAVLCGGANAATGGPGGIAGHVLVSPLLVTLDVSNPTPKAGRTFTVRAPVTNTGGTALLNVAVRLIVAPPLRLLDPARQVISRIGPGRTQTAQWQLCSNVVGNDVVVARATVGAYAADSPSVVVQVVAARQPSC